jgi:DNA-binding PadR family transcriptional regulator
MVVSYVGSPSPERGGRRRKHYILNDPGQKALGRAWRALQAMADGLEKQLHEM